MMSYPRKLVSSSTLLRDFEFGTFRVISRQSCIAAVPNHKVNLQGNTDITYGVVKQFESYKKKMPSTDIITIQNFMKNHKMFYAVCRSAALWRESRLTDKSKPCTNLLHGDLARIHESDEGWHVVIRDILQDNDGALLFIKRQHGFKVRTASRQHELQINT